jgi:hypothetical protein
MCKSVSQIRQLGGCDQVEKVWLRERSCPPGFKSLEGSIPSTIVFRDSHGVATLSPSKKPGYYKVLVVLSSGSTASIGWENFNGEENRIERIDTITVQLEDCLTNA